MSEKAEAYAREVEAKLRDAGFRVTGDYRPEKINSKIRDAQLELIPYMFVIGPKEAAAGAVAVRDRIEGDLGRDGPRRGDRKADDGSSRKAGPAGRQIVGPAGRSRKRE